MKTSEITKTLSEIDALVSGDIFSEIERDLVLEKLRVLYSSVLRMEVEKDAVPVHEEEDEAHPEVEVEIVMPEEEDEEPEDKTEGDLTEQPSVCDEEKAVSSPEHDNPAEQESTSEEHHEEVPLLKSSKPGFQQFLFPDMEPAKKTRKRNVIVANLYGATPQKDTPEVMEKPKSESPVTEESEVKVQPSIEETEKPVQIIQEKFEAEQKPTIATSVPPVEPKLNVAPPITSLLREISVMDKFVILNELFRGNETEYMKVIADLDAMPSIVDCMIYIDENYPWDPTSHGCRALMDILHRKFEKKN